MKLKHGPPNTNQPKNYMVCSTVRSGSTLLCKTLEQLDGGGQPQEYFHRHTLQRLNLDHNPDAFLRYCHTIFEESLTKHGVFGLKMHWWQLFDFLRLARQSPRFEHQSDLDILNSLFPDLSFIYLQRRDIVAQAVSAAIASQTGQWEKFKHSSSKGTKPVKAKPLKFQPWRIYEWHQALKAHNQFWQDFFIENHLEHHDIVYEDLVEAFPQEITSVTDYIGIHDSKLLEGIEIPTQRQFTPTNQRFINYYTRMPKPLSAMLYQLYRQLRPMQGGFA
ncbi:MAG: Stf0 family sulfotransferase [Cyanobacteria bacterium P01_F01_bin.4]